MFYLERADAYRSFDCGGQADDGADARGEQVRPALRPGEAGFHVSFDARSRRAGIDAHGQRGGTGKSHVLGN